MFQIGLAYCFVARGMARLPALEVSVLLLLEPVLNPVWTWLVHGEVPGVDWRWSGGGARFWGPTVLARGGRKGKA